MSLSNYTSVDGSIEFPRLSISDNITFLNDDIRLGNQAGQNNQSATAVAIGTNAGQNNQGIGAVAIGVLAGVNNQNQDAIAIGNTAGADEQQARSIAIGRRAGNDNQLSDSVAIGNEAGENFQSPFSIAIGYEAGFALQDESSIALGSFAGENSQGKNCVAIGTKAGQANQKDNAIAIGNQAGSVEQHQNTIVLNATGTPINTSQSNSTHIAPLRNLAKPNILYYDNDDGEITFAPAPSVGVPNLETVLSQGNSAGTYDINMNNQNITNVNDISANTINGTSYPPPPSNPDLAQVLSQGNKAGTNIDMSNNDILKVGNLGFNLSSVSIGNGAGGKNNDDFKVNVGFECGNTTQQSFTVAIGNQSGNQLQKASAVAIGNQAGRFNQGVGAIAIGRRAGDSGQGNRSIAIGELAGIVNQHTNTIILNATGSNLNSEISNALYVAPIRNTTNANTLYYNSGSNEITYSANPLPPPTPTLTAVLSAGNVAGTDINMNNKNLTNVNLINGTAYPPPVGATPNLSAVLAQGNSAGSNDLDMNFQSITNALSINNISINKIGNTTGILPITQKAQLESNEYCLYYRPTTGIIQYGPAPVGAYQKWVNKTLSREFNTNYTNNSSQPIMIAISISIVPFNTSREISVLVGGTKIMSRITPANQSGNIEFSFIVPPQSNNIYRVDLSPAATSQTFITNWSETDKA